MSTRRDVLMLVEILHTTGVAAVRGAERRTVPDRRLDRLDPAYPGDHPENGRECPRRGECRRVQPFEDRTERAGGLILITVASMLVLRRSGGSSA